MLTSEVLVLNAGFIPIRITSVKEAICLLTSEKAVSVIEEDRFVRSPSLSIRIPSVISVVGYSSFPRKKVAFSKLNVIYRDDMACQYCGRRYSMRELTVDHVIPRSRWESITGKGLTDGFASWKNLVCACRWCNSRKGNRLMKEIGWALLREPFEPEYMPHLVISHDKAEKKGWLPFCSVNVKIIDLILDGACPPLSHAGARVV
ncbi:MAG: HNH endonuclease [Spirochaetes bacterium]|jgi:5-methylcytosine-specific restriction endonuclease McrA|nr:HNH endonuclease [Spirochaetota bacterium]